MLLDASKAEWEMLHPAPDIYFAPRPCASTHSVVMLVHTVRKAGQLEASSTQMNIYLSEENLLKY